KRSNALTPRSQRCTSPGRGVFTPITLYNRNPVGFYRMSTVAHYPPRPAAAVHAVVMQRGIQRKPSKKEHRSKKPGIKVPIKGDRVEKRASVFLKLGRLLNTVRTPKDAATIILATADELFP